jgi:2',3'-cyclic-nucleotide 2'-phosphodiesterase (5'-nucleotidase family)
MLFLGSCAKHTYIVAQKNNTYSIDNQIKRDTSFENLITPYRTKIEGQMNEIIAVLDNDLIKVQPECTLGNLVADLMMEYCTENKIEGEVAVVNYNGLRIPGVSQGDLPRSKIFEVMPFDNAVVLLQLNKTQVVQLCDAMAQKGGWHISKGLRFEIHDGKSQNISINGKALTDDKTYPFVMSDYVANGGDNCTFLTTLPQNNCKILIRDMLLKQIEAKTKRGEHLSSSTDGRCVKK